MHPYVGKSIDQRGFILFMGVAMSITALPVLARMMQEYRITRTRLGTVTITAAATEDAVGWILLASITALVSAGFNLNSTLIMAVETIGFAVIMISVVKPLLARWVRYAMRTSHGQLDLNTMAILFVVLFLCSIATSLIGIFAIFGAFILGAVFSDQEEFRKAVSDFLQ